MNKIKNSVELLRMRKANPYMWNLIRILFPVDLYFKLKLNKYKHLVLEKYTIWVYCWNKLEALSSLANFAYLNPSYTFPVIIDSPNNQIIFSAKNLGHPLIKNETKTCNDFTFNPAGEIALITGSNMSGKSTLIKTFGINLSLAYAGSVVNANELKISLFKLFTCIKVNDSLTNGISFFYAEVKRLKELLDEIEKSEYPVFFLLDEIFRGTNNIERLKGGSMIIKKLAETNALGAIATHDFELVKLSNTISKLKNYHFKEEIKDGSMIFDYKLYNGPCPTTNALKIMKLAGLPVEE
jgi:DNA mismatch repair ATPase MutS